MKSDGKWYVIRTKLKLERKTAELLEKKQIAVYLPEYNRLQNLHGRKKTVKVLLLPSLFFAFLNEKQLEKIAETSGVAGILYKMNKPAVIKNKEIAAMQYFLTSHDEVSIDTVPVNEYDEHHTLLSGNIENQYTNASYQTEKLYLPSLGYKITAKTKEIFATNVA